MEEIKQLIKEIGEIRGHEKEWRNFAYLVGGVLGGLGTLLWWRGRDSHPYFLIGAGVLVLLGVWWPAGLRQLYRLWMGVAMVLGFIMTRVILSIAFFLILTPFAWIARLCGKRFLLLKTMPAQQSYWIHRQTRRVAKESYERQFS